MLEEELEEVLEIYDEIGAEISYRPVCLVEGNNKFFYQLVSVYHPLVIFYKLLI